ncbi:MAG: non-canonical purine NTP diphosphatase [Marinilabiliales bacterium]
MKKSLIFVSHNINKIKEIKNILPEKFELISLSEAGYAHEIPETGNTLEENALIKARTVYKEINSNCFADDTGLEVKALNNLPGVFSARYAGPQCNSEDNIDKLLQELQHHNDKSARFRTVIALIYDNNEFLFEGIVNGKIIHERRGNNGFGYDPVFVPDGYTKTFAEMSLNEKNIISHRARAFNKLISFLTRISH